jgi:hypothetical protein
MTEVAAWERSVIMRTALKVLWSDALVDGKVFFHLIRSHPSAAFYDKRCRRVVRPKLFLSVAKETIQEVKLNRIRQV